MRAVLHVSRFLFSAIATAILIQFVFADSIFAAPLTAGVAKVDITDPDAGPVSSPLYVKALLLKNDATALAIVTVDAVALENIGRIDSRYLPAVRAFAEKELGIPPANVLINASHCHGIVRTDVEDLTIQALRAAASAMTPVTVGAGKGHEDRISENRRYALKRGGEADCRHAYSLPFDDEIAAVGPIDPDIGVLRLDRLDGATLAVVYNFACHPILGVPNGANTADIAGFASTAIEENTGDGVIALFLQGCAGDINPVFYKDVDHPRDAEQLGNLLGLSALRAIHAVKCVPDERLTVVSETLALPRVDAAKRIADLETRQLELLHSLRGTSLNLKTFLPLAVKYSLSEDYPSYYANRYLHEERTGQDGLKKLDAQNRENMKLYVENIRIMEELTRLQANLDLLKKHRAENAAAASPTVPEELLGVRIGDFVLLTFPGEPSVQVGLDIKQRSPHALTFVAGYTNGYLYYAPTSDQANNTAYAQEDTDCILAPEWQGIFEAKAGALLSQL